MCSGKPALANVHVSAPLLLVVVVACRGSSGFCVLTVALPQLAPPALVLIGRRWDHVEVLLIRLCPFVLPGGLAWSVVGRVQPVRAAWVGLLVRVSLHVVGVGRIAAALGLGVECVLSRQTPAARLQLAA